METEVIILYAKKWQMTKEKDGEDRAGISVFFMLSNSVAPKVMKDGTMGYAVAKCSLSLEDEPVLQMVPGVYKVQVEMKKSGDLDIEQLMEFVSPVAK